MMRAALLFPLTALLLATGCARQGYPTGGPKDEQPPTPLATRPANESRRFTAREFYIQFDEYVALKNADQNVLVSPPMKHKPEFTTKGKGVLVRLNDTLREGTTYLFQFKEAVADFTEGNVLPSFEYVFSTGDSLDTLMLAGRVVDARNGKPWKEPVTVLACREESPFVTRCDKEGRFAFHYLPEGSYRLVAIEDKNRNLTVDAGEAVAWDTTAFAAYAAAADSLPAIPKRQLPNLRISAPEGQGQRVTGSEFTAKGRIRIVTARPMVNPSVEGDELMWRLNGRRDTMDIWCLDEDRDTARLVITDEGLQDTLKLRFRGPKGGRKKKGGKEEGRQPLLVSRCEGNKAFYDDLRLAFTRPVVRWVDSAAADVMLLKDSIWSRYPIVVDSEGMGARIEASLRSGSKYRVRIAAGLFTDLYGHPADSLSFELTPKDYGTLSLDIDNRMGHPLVIELLDPRDTVVQTKTDAFTHSRILTFSHLPAGEYRLRAVVDCDSNGRWTPGDYTLRRQPEEFVLFDKTLSLREKWEIKEKWVVERADEEARAPMPRTGKVKRLPGTAKQ